jgi:sulfhydrogenase subunit beta (sulfur reductase)
MMVLKAGDLIKNLLQLKEGPGKYDQVIVPFRPDRESSGCFRKIENVPPDKIDLTSYRTGAPPKYLFYFPRERVYPISGSFPKRVIAGLKACDIKAMELLDAALLKGGFTEPAYQKWRENTTIISSDCSEICKTCSCNLSGGKPYSEKGYDINISGLNGSYLLSVGSEKGEELLKLLIKDGEFREALAADTEIVDNNRDEILAELISKNKKYELNGFPSGFRRADKSVWMEESEECIGCGACTNVCPTCYCLILNDETRKEDFVKVRTYDSCQWYGYARVAGGGTPRPKMYERFRNRYLCKIDYMKSNFGTSGCTGCGRCTEACAAGIDFRKVIAAVNMVPQLEPESIE